jgi:hypothetical protein
MLLPVSVAYTEPPSHHHVHFCGLHIRCSWTLLADNLEDRLGVIKPIIALSVVSCIVCDDGMALAMSLS